jgi:hypothetical protein
VFIQLHQGRKLMKFKFKAVAAALAFAAVAGQASAASGGDVLLYVFDTTNGSSFVQDLGVTAASFIAAPSLNVTVSGADWTSFTGQASYATDTKLWGLLAASSTTQFASTIANGAVVAGPTAAQIANINGIATNVAGAFTVGALTNFAAAGSTGFNNWNVTAGNNMLGNVSFNTGNAFGATGVALDTFANSGARGAATTITPFLQTAAFNGSSLTVAAVPEPETYGMMAAGLLMLGAIARRRRV